MEKKTIFIADDHQLFIDGLEAIINEMKDFSLVGSARDGISAWEEISKIRPDQVILDINMPGMDGIELCRKIHEEIPFIKILMVSMVLEFGVIKMLLDLDVNGFVLKNAGKQELVQALRKISRGEKYFSSEIKDMYFARPSEHQTTRKIILTRREKEVLNLLSEGFSAKEIADQLFIGQSTVETHRKHLQSKFNVKNTAEMIRFAMENRLIK